MTMAGGRLVIDRKTFACGVDKRWMSLGACWALAPRRVSQWEDEGGGGRTRDAHKGVSPPPWVLLWICFSLLGKPTTCRHHELRLVEGVEKWLPSEGGKDGLDLLSGLLLVRN